MARASMTRRRLMSDINVVPYIDVMLVLLVIFMITAPLLTQGVKVELPQAAARSLPPEAKEPLVVTVDRQGRYFVNIGDHPHRPVDAGVLTTRVAAVLKLRPGTRVMVRADERVDYGTVVRVMALLQGAGVPSVGLVTEPPPRRR